MNFYFECAKVLDRLDGKHGSIWSNLGSLEEKHRKRAAALVIETLKYKAVLHDIILASELMVQEKRKIPSDNLALLLVYDLLFGKGIEASEGTIKQAVLRHKARINAELQRAKIKRGVKSNSELAHIQDTRAANVPRYIRINTLLWSLDVAIEYFRTKGFDEGVSPLSSTTSFKCDEHISNLLQFHPSVQFHEEKIYEDGQIILQDKASCFPPLVLNPPADENCVIIDATAAPGNKTTLLCALMKNKGRIYAFEKDRVRFKTLEKMLSKAGCKNVIAQNSDFLTSDPTDKKYSNVTHILLDPSCSGSGIVSRMDYLMETEEESNESQEQRLNNLAAFQVTMIKHAMSFPAVTKVVYSTCSVHVTENEGVVSSALRSAEATEFVLAKQDDVLPSWPRRGLQSGLNVNDAKSLIRCEPGEDRTNGFFVACFIRKSSSKPQSALTDQESQSNVRKRDNFGKQKKSKRRKKIHEMVD